MTSSSVAIITRRAVRTAAAALLVGVALAACSPQAEPALCPVGRAFQDCPECPEMVVLPPGRAEADEPIPQLAVGRTEVTFAQYDACAAAGGCPRNSRPDDRQWGRGDLPAINVGWLDAQEYAAWLSAKTGRTYRLLTDAEWVHAARAGRSGPLERIAASPGQYGLEAAPREQRRTAEVGSFAANAYGLHDMHGNVWEWVEDCYEVPVPEGVDPASVQCTYRKLRGGAWNRPAADVWEVGGDRVLQRDYDRGFRVAAVVIDPQTGAPAPICTDKPA